VEVGFEKRFSPKRVVPVLRWAFRDRRQRKRASWRPFLGRTPFDRKIEGKAEEFDCSLHVGRLVQMDAYPAAVGKDVVGLSPTGGHQFISDLFRKGNVDEMVAVHMTDFSPPQAIFRAPIAVRPGFDPRTSFESSFYPFPGA
jgi:hypothetical protein